MTAKVKCLSDAEGFKKGSVYPVLSFGETTCMLENDDGKVVGVALAKINDDAQWDLELGGDDERKHTKAEIAAEKAAEKAEKAEAAKHK
jgi:hypothetical protein